MSTLLVGVVGIELPERRKDRFCFGGSLSSTNEMNLLRLRFDFDDPGSAEIESGGSCLRYWRSMMPK